ncbi:MAG TPA: PKD domain-containing protein [Thermoanaerobaculia bacterium]|nr:PKD domain-containing protein [Thermoanaerobaculia bacterium]
MISVADSPNGAGRMPMGWFDGTGCGKPEQLMSLNPPGGSESYDQQIDVANGNAVSATAAAAALTTGAKYIAYYSDSSTLYVVDVTNPSFSYNATPLHAFSTVGAWAGVSRLTALGDGSSDRYLAGVFFTKGASAIKFASIGSDGTLTPLAASAAGSGGAASSPANQQIVSYRTSTGWLIFLVVSGGIDVFSFDGTSASRLGTIANGANKYYYLAAPYGSPTPILLAQKSSTDVDVIAGGYLAGQAGSPTVAATIAAVANDSAEGFGAYVDPSDPGNLYLYRAILASPFLMQTDTFDASCITSPPTPNPVASFVLTNKSAQNRADKNSYVGDAFSFTDTSKAGTGGAITNWYVWANYNASTSTTANADIATTLAPSLPSIVLPCQTLATNQCSYDPASIIGSSLSEKWGEEAAAGSLVSAVSTNSVTLKVPLTRVAAQGGDGSVKILTGGSIDASASDGSPAGFAWTFNGSPSSCTAATCAPPGGTTAFSVAANYAGGYQAAAVTGSVVFTDIAGSISVPATLFSGQSTTSATFALQKGSSVSITGVTYAYDNGSPTTITPTPPLVGNVTINVPSSLTTGANHTVKFTVSYSGGSLGSSVVFSDTFLYSAVQYAPSVWISKTPSMTATDTCSFNPFNPSGGTTCSGSAGTFYLSDAGDNGKPSFAATWNFGDGSPADTSHTTTDFVSHAFASGGPYTVTLTVQGTGATQKFTVGTTLPLTAGITGTTSVKAGTSATWSASASGGQPIYTYNWSSSDGGTGSGTSFTHTFNANGTITLTVHDSAGATKTATKSVTVTTGGCTQNCGNQIVISGLGTLAVNTPATWTASVAGVDPATIFVDWKINGASVPSASSYTVDHQFAAPGTYTLAASGSKIVGGSIITLTGASKTITVTGVVDTCETTHTCPPLSTFSVTGATFNQFGSTYSAKAGDVVAFAGLDTNSNTQFAWDFGDQTTGTGKAVTHAYGSGGNFNVTLTATNPNGGKHTSTSSKFTITGQIFSALIVPGAGDFAVSGSGGALATELSLFNNSNATVNIALDFEAVDASSIDPTKISFPTSGPGFVTLQPNQGWTTENVSSLLCENGTCGIGTLFLKYSGPQPSALARIYFSSGEGTPTYGTYLPAYAVTASGVSTLSAGSAANAVQSIVGLRFDDDFQGGITVVSASPTGGKYDVDLFRDDGAQMGTTLQETIPGYQQVKIHASDFGIQTPDPDHIYYATIAPSAGSSAPSIAIGTVKDNRTQDQLLLTDDTPRLSVPGGGPAYYYLAGVGRFASAGAKTDVYMLNTSAYPIPFNFRFHYVDGSGEHTVQISELLPIGGGQALAVPDVITSLFPTITGDVLGDLRIDYQVPADEGAVVIEGRNYTDLGAGTYGMQIPAYAGSDGLLPGSSGRIVLTGLHNDPMAGSTTDYDFISRFGFVALGDTPVTVHADAYDQTDGTLFWSGDFTLNSPGGFGHFLYIPTTGTNAPAAFAAHPAFNMVVTVLSTGSDGVTPAAAFATVKDTRSSDLVFIPGKRPSS